MFAVLTVKEREKDFLTRFSYLFHEPQPVLERVNVLGSAPFFVLTVVRDKKGKVDPDEVCRLLGRCASRLLLSEGTSLPSHPRIAAFRPELLPAILLFNSALRLLEKSGLPPEKLSVVLFDENAVFADKAEKLVRRASVIRVCTTRPEAYEETRRSLLRDWGLPLVVSENAGSCTDCDFAISPFGDGGDALSGFIALRRKGEEGFVRVRGEGLSLPAGFESVRPDGVGPLLFASALYELCGAALLGDLRYDRLAACGRRGER